MKRFYICGALVLIMQQLAAQTNTPETVGVLVDSSILTSIKARPTYQSLLNSLNYPGQFNNKSNFVLRPSLYYNKKYGPTNTVRQDPVTILGSMIYSSLFPEILPEDRNKPIPIRIYQAQ